MIVPSRLWRSVECVPRLRAIRWFHDSPTRGKTCDPLRVLFCGSDDFSIASLRALNEERVNGSLTGIESIDVVCRPGKRTGRGWKTIAHPPIHAAAKDLGLRLHTIDTFTGWQPPKDINLVIAVSFGLLVPPRILGAATYGGLNVHPSMLPDLPGAAPIQHTLLQRRKWTGISVQTLHPTKFDHGVIVAQSPYPGIPVPDNTSATDLQHMLARIGAQMLTQTLRDKLFIHPLQPIELSASQIDTITAGRGAASAPKIRPEDHHINWDADPSNDDILLRNQVLRRLWDVTTYSRATGMAEEKRIVYESWTERRIEGRVLEVPIQKGFAVLIPLGVENRLDPTRPIQLAKQEPEESQQDAENARKIYTSEFTIEGGPKGGGGKELLRRMIRHRVDVPFHDMGFK